MINMKKILIPVIAVAVLGASGVALAALSNPCASLNGKLFEMYVRDGSPMQNALVAMNFTGHQTKVAGSDQFILDHIGSASYKNKLATISNDQFSCVAAGEGSNSATLHVSYNVSDVPVKASFNFTSADFAHVNGTAFSKATVNGVSHDTMLEYEH